MDNKHIETFLCVFAECNITRAALKLNIVQPAVSTQLRKLEKELGVELFERSPRGMVPTLAGKELYRLFHPVISDFHVAQVEALKLSKKLIHQVRVGLNPHVIGTVLSPLLKRFGSEFPNVKIHVEEDNSSALLEHVVNGSLDLAVLNHNGLPNGLTATLAIEENLVLVEKSTGDEGILPPIRFADVVARGLILPSILQGYRMVLGETAAKAGLLLEPRLEINSPGPILEMVVSSNLATVLPEVTASRAKKFLPLRVRQIIDPPLKRQLWVVRRNERPLTPILSRLIDIIRMELEPEPEPKSGPDAAIKGLLMRIGETGKFAEPGNEPQVSPPEPFKNANSAAF